MCVTDRQDMTLAVKVALNSNTTNQPTNHSPLLLFFFFPSPSLCRTTSSSFTPLRPTPLLFSPIPLHFPSFPASFAFLLLQVRLCILSHLLPFWSPYFNPHHLLFAAPYDSCRCSRSSCSSSLRVSSESAYGADIFIIFLTSSGFYVSAIQVF